MKTFSVYRGQSRTGIGEGPGHPVAHGEQYLAADPPLAGDGDLLSAARPWMTLDWRPADEQALGDRIEAWSCFPQGDLRLFVRLTAAGIYDRRSAYFAHGRAVPVSEIAGARDPGAWLGRGEAFEEPWRDGQRPAPTTPPEPEMVRPAQVLNEPVLAVALLSHLYQGLVSGYPVILAVPVADFEAGSPVHALVSFARAALPSHLKADCRIRVFTRLPELFLRQLRADLVVIPENEAGNALATRRDAALLDRRGALREGRDPAREATAYAEGVFRRVAKIPGGLLAFSGAMAKYLPKDRLPAEQELSRIPILYNFLDARTDPARLGEWIKSWLLKQIADRPTGLDWSQLIRPEDWRSLAFGDLVEILVSGASSEEGRMLVRLAEMEARCPERREIVSDEWLRKRWSELPAQERPSFLARLLGSREIGRSLVESGAALRLSASLTLSELAAAADQSRPLAGLFAQATADGLLSEDWAVEILERGPEAAVRLAATILPAIVGSPRWQRTSKRLFESLLEASGLSAVLLPALEEALSRTGPDDLGTFLVLTELLVRAGSPRKQALIDKVWDVAEALSSRREQSDFIDRIVSGSWKSLPPDRLGPDRLSPSWARSFAGRILDSVAVRDQLSTALLLDLADSQAPLDRWLDSRMKAEPVETVTPLLQAGLWSLWRRKSKLWNEDRRPAALAWLGSGIWQSPDAPQARLEDWKQVVADLERLTGEELSGLLSRGRPSWPWITPFQDEQLKDLCTLSRDDLGALAELADGLDPKKDLGYPLQGSIFEHVFAQAKSSATAELPADILAYLSISKNNHPRKVLSPRVTEILCKKTTHRREQAESLSRRFNPATRESEVPRRNPPVLVVKLESRPMIHALARGLSDHECWSKLVVRLREYPKTSKPHPIAELAQSLRETLPALAEAERGILERKGWETFVTLTRICPLILQEPNEDGAPLPALDMAVLLLPGLGIGGAASRLLHLDATRGHYRRATWWRSLLAGLGPYQKSTGLWRSGYREETALGLIHQTASGLFYTSDVFPQVLDLLENRMERLYREQSLSFVRLPVPRTINPAGAAR